MLYTIFNIAKFKIKAFFTIYFNKFYSIGKDQQELIFGNYNWIWHRANDFKFHIEHINYVITHNLGILHHKITWGLCSKKGGNSKKIKNLNNVKSVLILTFKT